MLSFTNPGTIDLQMTQIFGVNVKETENPIGHFGTGLKYAIAIVLRLDGEITIYSGLNKYTFHAEEVEIRGKMFKLVKMQGPHSTERLPFTLELGKDWKPWMAYRELYSNALDEHGQVTSGYISPSPDTTVIQVLCPELDEVYEKRGEYFLDKVTVGSVMNYEIHDKPQVTKYAFYRGIRVGEFPKPGVFCYNAVGSVDLSEDRTLSSEYVFTRQTQRAILQLPEDMLQRILTAGENYWEWSCTDWDNLLYGSTIPDDILAKLKNIAATHYARLPPSIINLLERHTEPKSLTLTPVQEKMVERGKTFLEEIGYPITYPIKAVDSLDQGILGMAKDGHIYLTKAAFDGGTKVITGTLLEEQFHLAYGLSDCSRGLQNKLLDTIISLGEEKRGEPL